VLSKKGLGKGLGALIAEEGFAEKKVREIPLPQIEPNPAQPRKDFPQESLEELVLSMQQHGLLQPILVRPAGLEHYYIVAGERRYRAAVMAGFAAIACLVQDCTERESAERALIENIQRDDLSPLEEGTAYARLIAEYGLTQEQIAQRVGKSRPVITNLLNVVQLPEKILQLMRAGQLSLGHAKLLLGFDEQEQQITIAERAVNEGLSVRATEALIARLREPKKTERKPTKERMALGSTADLLSRAFQTKVTVKGDSARGKIEISYYSEEELNRLLELWRIEAE
jgi:ParB family chromosome partitioning protein